MSAAVTRPTDEPQRSAPAMKALTLGELQRAHIERQEEWCPDQKPDLLFRGNEMAGEVGEACNVIKKLERERQGWRGSRATKEQLAEELADVIHTAVLCAITAGVDIEQAAIAKFNATSEKNSLASRIRSALVPLPPPSGEVEDDGNLRSRIYNVLRDYGMTNFVNDDDSGTSYPLVDLCTPDGQGIDQGEEELFLIADEIAFALSSAPATGGGWRTQATDDVLAERRRQVEAEGWTLEHDDIHGQSEMATAAACYALAATGFKRDALWEIWPREWGVYWFKPATNRRNLVKAGALILAEIERLDRLPAAPTATGGQ